MENPLDEATKAANEWETSWRRQAIMEDIDRLNEDRRLQEEHGKQNRELAERLGGSYDEEYHEQILAMIDEGLNEQYELLYEWEESVNTTIAFYESEEYKGKQTECEQKGGCFKCVHGCGVSRTIEFGEYVDSLIPDGLIHDCWGCTTHCYMPIE